MSDEDDACEFTSRLMLPLMPMLTSRPLLLSDIAVCRSGALENRRMDKFLDDSVSHVVPRSFLGSMEVIGDVDSVVSLKPSHSCPQILPLSEHHTRDRGTRWGCGPLMVAVAGC